MSKKWSYEELDTPKKYIDYLHIYDKCINRNLEYLKTCKWKKESSHNDIKVSRCKVDGLEMDIIKICTIFKNIDGSKLFYDLLRFNNRNMFDKNLIQYKNINDIDNISHIGYSLYKTPIANNREFLFIKSYKKLDNNVTVIVTKSINQEDIPFTKNNIRGTIDSCVFLESTDKGIKFTSIDSINPKGFIPPGAFTIMKKSMVKILQNIKDYYEIKIDI